ncbi:MAG: FAD binding domain-containing protein [Tissierellia bacterium]|nr:FAD binding domain-containing protein [Tissierellia bacterium]
MVENRIPISWKDALDIRFKEDVIPYFGGTDLMVRGNRTKNFLFLNKISEIQDYIIADEIKIGAGVNYKSILDEENTPKLLRKIVRQIASPALRNMASVIGNICNASPVGDTIPYFYIYDAIIQLESKSSSRELEISDFIVDARKTDLRDDELVRAIVFQNLRYNNEYYQKVGPRSACSISKVDIVAIANTENNIVKDIRIAIGAVKNKIVRDKKFEEKLKGMSIEEIKSKSKAISSYYDSIISPIDDKRSTEDYRRQVAINLVEDFIENIK